MVLAPGPSYSFTQPGLCAMLSTYFTSTLLRCPVAVSTSSNDPTKYSGSYWSWTMPRYRTREFAASLPCIIIMNACVHKSLLGHVDVLPCLCETKLCM